MYRRIVLGVVVALAGAGVAAAAEELAVGDAAPKFEVKEFLKGQPVAQFAKGKTYVVEFWATWCGPCRMSIPHLTKLQKKYPDVTFIGVSIWERNPDAVKPFVQRMSEKMDYRVAADKLIPGADEEGKGVMSSTWMDRANLEGIPAAFVVDGNGKIAWIGNPLELEKPLGQIAAGKWDLAVAAADYKKDKARKAHLKQVIAKLGELPPDDRQGALKIISEAIDQDAELEKNLGRGKFQLLLGLKGRSADALSYGKKLAEKFKEDAEQLSDIAWSVVDPEAPKASAKLLKFALEVAQLADEVDNYKNPSVAHVLARAYFSNGNVPKAVETEERAIKLAKGSPLEGDETMKERLREYKKALPKN